MIFFFIKRLPRFFYYVCLHTWWDTKALFTGVPRCGFWANVYGNWQDIITAWVFSSHYKASVQERCRRLTMRRYELERPLEARLDRYNMSLGRVVFPHTTVYMIVTRSQDFVLKRDLTLSEVAVYVSWLEEHSSLSKEG